MRSRIITGLDIGTNSIKALVAERGGDEWNVLSLMQFPSFGLRKGAVVNPEEVTRNIQLLKSRLEKECGRRISSAFVNISGSHLRVEPSDGLISVSRADHIISQEDIERVLQAARAINIPSNEEILDVFPREFIIDDQKGIKQPLGLTGVRLQAKAVLLCYFQSYFINLTQAVLNAGLQIDDIVPSPLAAARAVLTPEQKEIGTALIDIGASTTSLAVFQEGDLIHLAVLPLGSGNITNDIAIGLRTEVDIAEDIKKQYGSCLSSKSDSSGKKISYKSSDSEHEAKADDLENQDNSLPVAFTRKNLVSIIEPRVVEILNLMQRELRSISQQDLLPGGVVLTGGGVKMPKIDQLVKQYLKLPCRIGRTKGIVGLIDDPALATVAGLVLGGVDFEEEGGRSGSGFGLARGLGSKIKKVFKIFIP